MTKTRNNAVDLLRLVAAFAVICLHNFTGSGVIFAEETVALSRFAVPLFFLFSGYFAAGFSTKRKWRQALKLFLLAVFSNLAYLALELSKQPPTEYAIRYRLRELYSTGKVWELLLYNESSVSAHLWFLGALLYCILLDILFSTVTKKLRHRTAVLGSLSVVLLFGGMALYHLLTRSLPYAYKLFYYRNFLWFGMPFYLAGKLLRDNPVLQKPLPLAAYAGLIAGSCVLCMGEFKLLGPWELYLGSILLALTLAQLAVSHPLVQPKAPVRALAWLGRYASLPVYIVHIYFLNLIRDAYYANLPWQYELGLFHLIPLATLLASLCVGAVVGAGISLWGRRKRNAQAG